MKKLVISTLFVMQVLFVFAQTGTGVSGKVLDSKTQKPLQNVVTSIQNTNLTQITDGSGKFVFKGVPVGNQLLQVRSQGYKDQLLQIEIVAGKMIDVGIVVLDEDITEEQQNSLITITDNDLGDDNSGSESTSALLQASRDAFQQAAAYNFGQARFSVRGIDNEYSTVMINGVSMNRLSDGRPQYSNWGGLNDATRNQEFTDGSKPSDYTFGGIAGTQEMNTQASIYRKGTRLSFLSTNTNYNFRAMVTHASGMDKDGWAYVISGGRRWAEEGHFDGTTYAANSLFASVEKRINANHSLNLTSMYAQNRRGKNSPNTDEITNLKDFKYNSYWGWQEGEKRNSREKVVEEPIIILSHYWKLNSKSKLNTNVSYQTGKIGNSRIDFQAVDNPDPTYYKKLPSYATTNFIDGVYSPNFVQAEGLKQGFLSNPQLNWTAMYNDNRKPLNINTGSVFVLYEDRTDDTTVTANSIFSTRLSDNIVMNAGATFTNSKSENFKNLLDLLGGNFYNDVNLFGVGSEQDSDTNNPGRIVGVNDRYGYNYNINATKIDAFTQFKFTYKKVDFYLAQTFSRNSYQREGLYRNGFNPTNSFGKSDKLHFDNFGFKGGLTYKISGRHYVDFNGVYMSKAPNTKDVFPYARQNNNSTENISNEGISSMDLSYIIKTPKLKARFTGFFNETKNSTDVAFYYADAINTTGTTAAGEFVTEVITGQNKRNIGIEAGIEYQITSTIKATAVAAFGEYKYTNDSDIKLLADGIVEPINDDTVAKIKNYKVAGTPQEAYSIGLEYRDPKFWWIGANANYLAKNYVDVSPLLRTNDFYDKSDKALFPTNQNLADQYLQQEQFDSFMLFNVVGGKSWRIGQNTLGIFANVNNILDKVYKTGGFEQARNATYSELYKDYQGPNRSFGNKYFYGYGRTFMVNVYLTF
ncbi:MAG: TonB-dependent receptor [Flavobacterium sp.]|uniref:TonB-dependent receptor n=1 Tax=Flavobacterium sp. TaxID=239 RepID=UPI0022C62B08|nr:TonB-dependent receptor [Flavobacterium sp.]MCZ8197951.1 TonB-dependent receptor [Flavobacterium sp.]